MNRRQFAASGLIATGVLLAGCEPARQRPSAELKSDLEVLDSAIGTLESKIGDFDQENWKDVVPEVKSAAAEVRSAFYKIREALGGE